MEKKSWCQVEADEWAKLACLVREDEAAAAAAWRLCRALEHDLNSGDEDAWDAYLVARKEAKTLDPDGIHDLGPY